MLHTPSVLTGVATAIAIRAAMPHLIKAKLNRDLARLNEGDYGRLLAGFADDAVLHFNNGDHRWAGSHRGKAAIEAFLREFVAAGLHGKLGRLWLSGPPWAMELCVRFDDEAHAANGEQIYANRTVLWVSTRWGRIVEQRDFYEDTQRIVDLEAKLVELGR